MIIIDINTAPITARLADLQRHMADLSPVMEQIADMLVVSTKKRFAAGTAPDGTPWAANSPVTLARKSDPRPLFGNSGDLNSRIFGDSGPDFVEVGSDRVYAAMMHYGGTKAAFPHLWGDIPARPFLGLSEMDEANVLDEISEWLTDALSA